MSRGTRVRCCLVFLGTLVAALYPAVTTVPPAICFLPPSTKQVDMSSDGCLEVAWKGQAFPYLLHHPADPSSAHCSQCSLATNHECPRTEPSTRPSSEPNSFHLVHGAGSESYGSAREEAKAQPAEPAARKVWHTHSNKHTANFAASKFMSYLLSVQSLAHCGCVRRWQQECGMAEHRTASSPPMSRAKPSHQQLHDARSLDMLLWAS